MSEQGRQWPAREPAGEWNPPTDQLLVTGSLPAGWNSERYWIDLVPGAEVELPGAVVFRCFMDRINDAFHLRLAYSLHGNDQEFSAVLGSFLDLSLITGFPCVLIPRAIKPANTELPAAVLLEFARVVPQ